LGVKRKIGFILILVGILALMVMFSWATQQNLDAQPNDPVPDYSASYIIISSTLIAGVSFLIWGTLGSKTQRTIPNLIILVIAAVIVFSMVTSLIRALFR
jgi:hypothetical protein